MKAPSFGYVKPRALGEVFDLLDQHGDEAKLLAGGQSLMPSLNLRLSSPAILIDLNAVPGLAAQLAADVRGIDEQGMRALLD